jgi:hypothetical protein
VLAALPPDRDKSLSPATVTVPAPLGKDLRKMRAFLRIIFLSHLVPVIFLAVVPKCAAKGYACTFSTECQYVGCKEPSADWSPSCRSIDYRYPEYTGFVCADPWATPCPNPPLCPQGKYSSNGYDVGACANCGSACKAGSYCASGTTSAVLSAGRCDTHGTMYTHITYIP